MTWHDYVTWTGTTALPIASDPEYLRLGVLEEGYEALEAYSAYCAAFHGRQKRILRGDAPKDDAIAIAKRRLVEELGDLAWYVARMHSIIGSYPGAYPTACEAQLTLVDQCLRNLVNHRGDMLFEAFSLLRYMLGIAEMPLDLVLDANVAKLTARKSAGTIQGEGER